MGEKVKKKKKKKGGEPEEGDNGAALSPSRPVHRSAPFASRFFVLVSYRCFFVFVLVFALFPTTEPVLRQTLFFPFQISISYLWINVLQIITARKGNANVGVSA